jgi:hypothetical protein
MIEETPKKTAEDLTSGRHEESDEERGGKIDRSKAITRKEYRLIAARESYVEK